MPKNNSKSLTDWNSVLTDIEKLMLFRALKEEKLIFAITSFVKKNLGDKFVESPIITLNALYDKFVNKNVLKSENRNDFQPIGLFPGFLIHRK